MGWTWACLKYLYGYENCTKSLAMGMFARCPRALPDLDATRCIYIGRLAVGESIKSAP
jgi:hypothetical protein